jgi:hypothetical protein
LPRLAQVASKRRFRGIHYGCFSANGVVLCTVDSYCLCRLNRNSRRGLWRAARVLPGTMRTIWQYTPPQILLFVYLQMLFSHYVALFFLILTRYKLFFADRRDYLIALFALVWIANQYMSIYNRLRLDIKHERVEIEVDEKELRKEELRKEEKTARPQAA